MKKHILLFVMLMIFVVLSAASAERLLFTIKKTGPQRGPVTIDHRNHKVYAIDQNKCKTCHHRGKLHQSCGDSGCHNDSVKDKGGQRIHKTCIDKCHKVNNAKTPTSCSDKRCHKV